MNEKEDNQNIIFELTVLTKSGKYKEALDKHIWFHEASKEMSGMGGVRLSFALGLWMKLAEQYPPALEALFELRNSKRDALLNGKGAFDEFHDLSEINKELGETDDTASVFMQIYKKYPEQSKVYYNLVEDFLVARKEYAICGECMGDPQSRYLEIEHLHQVADRYNKKHHDSPHYSVSCELAEERYVQSVSCLLQILIGLNKNDIANDIQNISLEYFDSKVIRELL